MRTSPNVIITGTPGVGKTVHCEQIAQDTGLRHLSINQVAKDRGCFESYDEELETWVVDEDKVCCPYFVTLVYFFFTLFFRVDIPQPKTLTMLLFTSYLDPCLYCTHPI